MISRISVSPSANIAAKRQVGFSLIEVLVSVVILSIGLIGIAGLQAASLRNNQSAFMRSQATVLAYDLADRMRANIAGANGSFYDPGSAALTASCKTTAGCSPQQLAEHDLEEWRVTLQTFLPMGQGFVCRDTSPNDGTGFGAPACDGAGTQFVIKIWWDDDGDGLITSGGAQSERFVISYQL